LLQLIVKQEAQELRLQEAEQQRTALDDTAQQAAAAAAQRLLAMTQELTESRESMQVQQEQLQAAVDLQGRTHSRLVQLTEDHKQVQPAVPFPFSCPVSHPRTPPPLIVQLSMDHANVSQALRALAAAVAAAEGETAARQEANARELQLLQVIACVDGGGCSLIGRNFLLFPLLLLLLTTLKQDEVQSERARAQAAAQEHSAAASGLQGDVVALQLQLQRAEADAAAAVQQLQQARHAAAAADDAAACMAAHADALKAEAAAASESRVAFEREAAAAAASLQQVQCEVVMRAREAEVARAAAAAAEDKAAMWEEQARDRGEQAAQLQQVADAFEGDRTLLQVKGRGG